MLYEPLPIGRVCRKCGLWKPYAELKKLRSHSTGVDARCLKCHNEQTKQRRASNPDKYRELDRQYRAENIEKYRARDKARDATPERYQYRIEYGRKYYQANKAKHKEQSRRYAKEHPEALRRSQQRYAKSHPEQVNARKRRWDKRHPENKTKHVKLSKMRHPEIKQASEERRRARKSDLPDTFTLNDYRRMMEYWGYCCAACGRPAGLWHTIAVDHWIPLSSPNCPGTVVTNMLPLCHSQRLGDEGCNNTKWSFDPMEWLNRRFGPAEAKRILKRIQDYFDWVNAQK